jgi:integrase
MIGLRKLKGRYYCRVHLKDHNGKWKDKLIALNTEHIREAEMRRTEVRQFEQLIKAGGEFIPSWRSENGNPEIREYSLDEAARDYLKARNGDGLRPGTLDIYERSFSTFRKVVKGHTPVKEITLEHIDKYKAHYTGKIGNVTLNMRLRALRTFLIWLKERGKIKDVPKITQLNVGKSLPKYVSNDEFREILSRVPDHFKKAFWFYRETGCRLSEPFQGIVNGDFLTITADTAKGHSERDIHLTPKLKSVLLEMRAMVDYKVKRGIAKRKSAILFYSDVFYKACKGSKEKGWGRIEGRKFHSLRHTAAVRLYLKTRDIYAVMKQLGHSSVTTTEIYTKFNIKRLEQDFPDLVKPLNTEKPKLQESDTELQDTGYPVFA